MKKNRRVFIGLPSYEGFKCSPFNRTLIETVKLFKLHGYSVRVGVCVGNPYVQAARNILANKFRKSGCSVFMFFDEDMSWKPADALRLLETEGDVVAGVYPMDNKLTFFCGLCNSKDGRPLVRSDGCIKASRLPTGFMKIEGRVFDILTKFYPELAYGKEDHDFFPQGVHNHIWVGEDFAFCDLWYSIGGKLWLIPDVDFIHHKACGDFKGNYHEYLMQLPGGCNYKG